MTTGIARWGMKNVVLPFGIAGVVVFALILLKAFNISWFGANAELAMALVLVGYGVYVFGAALLSEADW